MGVNSFPEGLQTIAPTLCVDNAAAAISFYKQAFGAIEFVAPVTCPTTGKIMHAELKFGNSVLFLCDEFEQFQIRSPKSYGGSPAWLFVYFDDVDAQHQNAIATGAECAGEPTDMFWGDRVAMVTDPFGYKWALATHKEDLTPEQIDERMKAAFDQPQA